MIRALVLVLFAAATPLATDAWLEQASPMSLNSVTFYSDFLTSLAR